MNRQTIITALKIIAIPVIYLLVLILVTMLSLRQLIRVSDWFNLAYYGFILLLPFIVGFITVYLSTSKNVGKWQYRVTAPWEPFFILFIITLVLFFGSWVFLLVCSPIFMAVSSIGGLMGGYLKLRKQKRSIFVN